MNIIKHPVYICFPPNLKSDLQSRRHPVTLNRRQSRRMKKLTFGNSSRVCPEGKSPLQTDPADSSVPG